VGQARAVGGNPRPYRGHGPGGADAAALVEDVFDPLAGEVVLAVDAVQIDVMQDPDAVASAGGDFGGSAAGVEPQRQGGVPGASVDPALRPWPSSVQG
jgi:hypothetical protein